MQPRNLHIDAVALVVIALLLLVFQHVPSPRPTSYPARQVRFEQRMNAAAERMQSRADQMAARWSCPFR